MSYASYVDGNLHAHHVALDKRWRARDERWISPGNLFDENGYGVEIIPDRIAKPFVVEHHYSGTYPASRLAVGLFRATKGAAAEMCGVAVFSVGIQPRSIPAYTGYPAVRGVELGRFVLLDSVGYNGETWFLRRALCALRSSLPDVDVVLSYADPMERRDPITAALQKPAHYGTIYQAGNAVFAGRARPGTLVIAPNGRTISRRALSKITLGEQGRDYAIEQLRSAGVPSPQASESPAVWLSRMYQAGVLRRVRHPGNFADVFGLSRAAKSAVFTHARGGKPYPKEAA